MSRQDIPLVARDGWRIPNSIESDPTALAVETARHFADPLILRQATALGPPSGRYNCHGLVFASRRANIPPVGEDVDIDALLVRDGYRRVTSGLPHIGDIAAYRDVRNEIEHTGFVCAVDMIGAQPVVRVWSMWGALGEFCHRAESSPYSQSIEYWRLR